MNGSMKKYVAEFVGTAALVIIVTAMVPVMLLSGALARDTDASL